MSVDEEELLQYDNRSLWLKLTKDLSKNRMNGVFREEVEIKKHIYLKITLSRGTAETFLSPFIINLFFPDRFYIDPQNHIL